MIENFNEFMAQVDPDVNYFNNYTDGFTGYTSEYVSIEEFNSIGKNNTILNASLLNYNIRSYHANRDTFDAILKSMIKLPTFMVITESWNTEDTVALCSFDGYTGVHTYRTSSRGGGVSVIFDGAYI